MSCSTKKIKLILGFLCLLIVSKNFAGDYDQRRQEVYQQLESLTADAALKIQIKDKLARYFDGREKVLSEALPIVNDESTSSKDQGQKWKDYFQKAAAEAGKQIYDILQDGLPANLLLMLTTTAALESDFFSKMADMPMATLRDRITVYRETFDRESKSLSDKWREVNYLDQSIDSGAQSAQRELQELYQRTLSQFVANSSNVESWIRTLVNTSTSIDGTPEVVGVVKELLDTLGNMETRSVNLAEKLKTMYSQEERVILVFLDTRKDVTRFLSTMNLSLLSQETSEKLVQSEQKARSVSTNGQIADATTFYDRLKTINRGHYEDFEDQFEKFVSQFDHIFFNALGDRTLEDLLESQSWRSWSDGVRGIALEAALKRIYDQASRNFGIDISQVRNPAQKELVEKWVNKNLEAIKSKLGKVEELSVSDRLQLVIYSSLPSSWRQKLMDKLKDG